MTPSRPAEPVSRTASRTVACPACGADVDQPCVGVRGKTRESSHMERALSYAQEHGIPIRK